MRNREKLENECLYCGKKIPKRNVYCNNKCQSSQVTKNNFKLLEEGRFEKLGNNASIDRTTKKYLIEKYGAKCMVCGWSEVNKWTKIVPVELNHKDGDPENHHLINVELLCPSHHSLTEFHKSRGKGRKWRKTIFLK